MRTQRAKRNGTEGSALLLTLCIVLGLSFALAGYLALVRSHHALTARSEAWNAALVMAEAGAEEALAQVNPGAAVPSVDLWANGWGMPSSGFYGPKSRTLGNGSYSVVFTDTPYPVIYSTGSVYVAGTSTKISRVIRVVTTNSPLFSAPFGAIHNITMNGSGVSSDSFDSSKPLLSNNGYYDPSRTSTNGDMFSVYGPVDFGNHTIAGDLLLGPTAQLNSSSNQVGGTVYNDLNIDFPPVVPPTGFSSWSTATVLNTNIDGVTYKYAFFGIGNYTVPDSANVYVGPNAKVKLRITAQDFSPDSLYIAGSDASAGSLIIYMEGASCTLGGNTTVENQNAANLSYYGLPENTSITYGGNSSFVGTIYAPNADLVLNGGGNNVGVVGACITKTITMNGHYDFHFDESLLRNGPTLGFIPIHWREL